jgi:mannose-6-phosphate isomerase-like protein (cupin superfamily)
MAEQGDYRINYEPLFGPLQLIDIREASEQADHPWYNQTLIEVGGVLLRLGVFAGGEYHWHKHQEQDEFFYVIDGRLRIELEGRDPVELASGMAFSVPRGMLHRPVALEPTQVLMMEKAGVAVTGD